jgi:hypothetical protein
LASIGILQVQQGHSRQYDESELVLKDEGLPWIGLRARREANSHLTMVR